MIVDAHLDLAYNAMLGRDLTLSLTDLRERDALSDVPAVTFGELRRGGVGLCLGTLFAMPQDDEHPWGYEDWRGARQQAVRQLDQYLRWQDDGHVVILTTGADVRAHADAWSAETSPLGVVLLMEGADAMRDADELPFWVERGVRVVGPAWKRTRYSGGTDAPGGLTDRGRELMIAMQELRVVLDASHLAEQAYWDTRDYELEVIASHSNARALVPTDRHLTDDMLRDLHARDGMVGVVLYNKFLQHGWERGHARPPLERVAVMLRHMAGVVGWARLGIGSDLDGGFGVSELPAEFRSAADVARLAECVPDEHRDGFMGANWVTWLERHL